MHTASVSLARTENDRLNFIRAAKSQHENFWEERREEMRKYRNAYLTKFYADVKMDETMLTVETADGYATIESIMGSLFSKYPAVEFKSPISGGGDIEITKAVGNDWLKSCRDQIENAGRMALIYTHSFLKLAPRESNTLLGKIAMRAVPPWQVILDRDASAWEDARFIGHAYYVPIDTANSIFGNKKWKGVAQTDYFTSQGRQSDRNYSNYDANSSSELPNEYLYVQVIEMYDFLNNELLFWSPQYKNGDELLSKDEIPVTTYDDRPLSNIVPFYFSKSPDRPMEGYSAMSRSYDQIFEKNILRTFWANAVRRDSRQYIYKKGAFDEGDLAKITAGVDGALIPVEGDTIGGLIDVVPVAAISGNQGDYLNYIEADLTRASLVAGFTRGEATRATATEVTALAQYTASELGKLARSRDATLEAAVVLYLRMLIPLMSKKDKTIVLTESGARIVTVEALDGDWEVFAADNTSTPITEILQKQQIMQLLPILPQLGVTGKALKDELIRLFNLPVTFAEEATPPEPVMAPGVPAIPGAV